MAFLSGLSFVIKPLSERCVNMRKFLLTLSIFLMSVGPALATAGGGTALDLSSFTIDTQSPKDLALIVLGGLGVLWAIRKVIKIANRS